ncbi:polyphosphate kinase 2 family protein [Pseudanabaena sp. FACHB-2040]|uniref:polyphosphate kinase 2 family protein n=1 Tax=Pseudanabaena sp. FACHB-2040 TaxID=2692859 RepID=UPI001688AA42|nr:polyphosphate kinase 2 family protein [Pseudanabaena sp. FACHB-2040]MBD0268972.1 polyphosphate kinase 2 family protein [Cyanobacteria bacterium Co-bin8]MBD2257182.1 polyphosphate kinase 2 family protein [Pseudanabaena sp. FACHB-2040]
MRTETFVEALQPQGMVVKPGQVVTLKEFDASFTGTLSKIDSQDFLQQSKEQLARFQDMLYAQDTYALLIILQAMDAAGKDGTIKHVMSGLNPQGCQVFSFKAPSAEELDHDYLWRCFKALPERGRIGIFNRSYYEEVLAVRVHPKLLEKQQLPPTAKGDHIWQQRFEEINHFEKYLVNNGILVLKFFLHVSKEEQKKRFMERINRPEKNWKLSPSDAKERAYWDDYMASYEDVFNNTSTDWAPWHVIPADHKWFTRLSVAYFIAEKMKSLNLAYPQVNSEHLKQLQVAREILENEA